MVANLRGDIGIAVGLAQHLNDSEMTLEGCPMERGPSTLRITSREHNHKATTHCQVNDRQISSGGLTNHISGIGVGACPDQHLHDLE
jgi:hypothetical protein